VNAAFLIGGYSATTAGATWVAGPVALIVSGVVALAVGVFVDFNGGTE